jgi:hypothetical protein
MKSGAMLTEISHTPTTRSRASSEWREGIRAWWQRIRQLSRRTPRQLRLCESLPLGERRFVAVVQFEQSRFLLGGTSASLVLLAQLGNGDGEVNPRCGAEAAATGEGRN